MIYTFVYNNEKYPISLKLLNKETDFFINNKNNKGKEENEFQLLNEFETNYQLSTETISTFLDYFKTGRITLTSSNIFCLNHLSTKYEIPNIQIKTSAYMKNNYKELIDNILNRYDYFEGKEKNKKNNMNQE